MNKSEILERVTEEQIFSKYCGPVKLGKMIRSPLRKDNTPSFHIFKSNKQGGLIFKDFGSSETGDCFKFIQLLFRTDFKGALKIIEEDFNLIANSKISIKRKPSFLSILSNVTPKEDYKFEYVEKSFTIEEYAYWRQYGITPDILAEYNVVSIEKVKGEKWYHSITNTPNCPIFAYKYLSGHIRFYRPRAFDKKHFGNADSNDVFGYQQLYKEAYQGKSPCGFIALCAGQKDALSFYANTGHRAVSLNSESANLTKEIYDKLIACTVDMYICYDMDDTGRKQSAKLCKEYGFIDLMTDYKLNENEKDLSDYYARVNKEELLTV